MSDEKQEQTTGKPNKFEEQKRHAEERKAGESPRQGEPVKPVTPETPKTEPATTETTPQKK